MHSPCQGLVYRAPLCHLCESRLLGFIKLTEDRDICFDPLDHPSGGIVAFQAITGVHSIELELDVHSIELNALVVCIEAESDRDACRKPSK